VSLLCHHGGSRAPGAPGPPYLPQALPGGEEWGQGVRGAGETRVNPSVVPRWEGWDRLGLEGAPEGRTLAPLRKSFPSTSAWKCCACSWSPTAGRAASACWTPPPQHCLSQRQQNQSPFPPRAHLAGGTPPLTPPEQIPTAPSPQAATRAGCQSWSTNATDFISDHLAARCQRAGGGLGPALATVPS